MLKLRLRGIRSFSVESEQSIDFDQNLTLIVGHNGAGKTTIIEALRVATTGSYPPNCENGKAFIFDPKFSNKPETKASIKLDFLSKEQKHVTLGRLYTLTRKQGNVLEIKKTNNMVQVPDPNGKVVKKDFTINKMDEFIPELLGVKPAILNNVTFCHQDIANWPFDDSAQLKKIFDEIFDTDRFSHIHDTHNKFLKSKREHLKKQHPEFAVTESKAKQSMKARKDLKELQCNVKDLEQEVDDKAYEVKEANAKRAAYLQEKEHLDEYRTCETNLKNARSMYEIVKHVDIDTTADTQSVTRDIDRNNQHRNEVSKNLQRAEQALVRAKTKRTNAQSEAQQHQEAVNYKKRQIADMADLEVEVSDKVGPMSKIPMYVKKIKTDIADKRQERAEIQKEVDEMNQQKMTLKIQIREKDKQRQEVQVEYDKLLLMGSQDGIEQMCKDLTERSDQLVQKINDGKTKHMDLEKALAKSRHSAEEITEKVRLAQVRQKELDAENERRIKLQDLKEKIQELAIHDPDSSGMNINKLVQIYENKINQANQQKTASACASTAIKEQIKAKEKKTKQLEEELDSKEQELRRLVAKLNEVGLLTDTEAELEHLIERRTMIKQPKQEIEIESFRKLVEEGKRKQQCPVCSTTIKKTTEKLLDFNLNKLEKAYRDKRSSYEQECLQVEDFKRLVEDHRRDLKSRWNILNVVPELNSTYQILKSELGHKYDHAEETKEELEKDKIRVQKMSSAQQIAASMHYQGVVLGHLKLEEISALDSDEVKDEIGQEISSLFSQLHTTNAEIENLEVKVHRRQKQNESLNVEYIKTKDERVQLANLSDHAALAATISKIKAEIEQLEENLDQQQDPDEKSKYVIQLDLKIRQKEDKLRHWQSIKQKCNSLLDLRTSLEKAQAALTQRRVTVEQAIEDADAKKTEIQMLQEELKTLEDRAKHFQETLANLDKAKQAQQLRRKIETLSEQLLTLEEKFTPETEANLAIATKYSESLTSEYNKIQGRCASLQDNLSFKEADVKANRHYEKKASRMAIERAMLELAIVEHETFLKELNNSIIAYHSNKLDEINQIIYDLWQKTYKGEDIETIEIRAEQETRSKARSYIYKLVMVGKNKSVNMRGRCSAGQRVMASLIIRLALAEAFANTCNVIALDEPTTNLDRANSDSLADALSALICEKPNFQFMIITHDKVFAQHVLHQANHNSYYIVSKKEYGSVIKQKNTLGRNQ